MEWKVYRGDLFSLRVSAIALSSTSLLMLRLNHGALLDLRLLSVNVRCSAYETGSSRLAALSKMLLKPNCVGVCVNLMGTLWKVANEYYRATLLTVHLGLRWSWFLRNQL